MPNTHSVRKPLQLQIPAPSPDDLGVMNIIPIIFNKSMKEKRSIGVIPTPQIYSSNNHIFRSDSHIQVHPTQWRDAEFLMRKGFVLSSASTKEETMLLFQVDQLKGNRHDTDKTMVRLKEAFRQASDLMDELISFYQESNARGDEENMKFVLSTDEGRILANALDLLDYNDHIIMDKYSRAETSFTQQRLVNVRDYFKTHS